MEGNHCYIDVDKKVLSIGDETSSEEKEANTENTLFTFKIKVENEEIFLEKLYQRFESWDPLYFGKPRRKLVKSTKRN